MAGPARRLGSWSPNDQLQRPVAIQVPHPERVKNPDDAEAYLTEARTVANLRHPNIVTVCDVGSKEQFPVYVISMFIDGTNLARKRQQSAVRNRQYRPATSAQVHPPVFFEREG
jgi:serine/threonine protein kinase